jgi:hypothetical protein
MARRRAPRLQLTADFRDAVRKDSRGIVCLAHALGVTSYPNLSHLIHAPRISGTALNRARLQQLAALVGFEGEVFRG